MFPLPPAPYSCKEEVEILSEPLKRKAALDAKQRLKYSARDEYIVEKRVVQSKDISSSSSSGEHSDSDDESRVSFENNKEAMAAEGWVFVNNAQSAGFIDQRVRRHFPGHPFSDGRVVAFLSKEKNDNTEPLWHVVHDDGDEEDLNWQEVQLSYYCIVKDVKKSMTKPQIAAALKEIQSGSITFNFKTSDQPIVQEVMGKQTRVDAEDEASPESTVTGGRGDGDRVAKKKSSSVVDLVSKSSENDLVDSSDSDSKRRSLKRKLKQNQSKTNAKQPKRNTSSMAILSSASEDELSDSSESHFDNPKTKSTSKAQTTKESIRNPVSSNGDVKPAINIKGTDGINESDPIDKLAQRGDIDDDDLFMDESVGSNDVQESEDSQKEEPDEMTEAKVRAYKEALEWREAVFQKISSLGLPGNPLDLLIYELGGTKKVAELTGRKGRLEKDSKGRVRYRLRSESNNTSLEKQNMFEKESFMSGRKRVAILSEAASSGISLQADKREKNQQRRVHITLELSWSADKTIQANIHYSFRYLLTCFFILF